MKWMLACFFILISVAACRDNKKPLDKNKMQDVLWDVIKLEAYSQHLLAVDTVKRDTAKIFAMQEKVFSLHGITREQYLESYKYYDAHPEYMRAILDSITTRAQSQRNFIMQRRYGKDSVK